MFRIMSDYFQNWLLSLDNKKKSEMRNNRKIERNLRQSSSLCSPTLHQKQACCVAVQPHRMNRVSWPYLIRGFERLPTKDGTQVTLKGLQDDALDLHHRLAQELFAGIAQQFIFCHHLHLVPMWTDIVS